MFNKSSLINQVPTDLIVGTSTVAENEAIGKVVGTFKTTDPDLANTFIYSLVAGTGSTDNASFTIVGNQLKTNAVFDFETKNSYSVRVRTTDQGGLFYEKQLNIGINNTNELANLSQYANSVIGFSSQYTTTSWSASQALGAPNTFAYGDITTAWAPVLQNGASEFLTLGFNTPVYATGVTIRETYGNGFVSKIETLDLSNVYQQVWAGIDGSLQGSTADFTVNFAQTNYLVKGVRITVNPLSSTSWEEIDAVQLHGTANQTPIDNQAPTNLTLSNSTVAENQPIATVVGNLSSTDPDTGNTFTYSLVSGTGATDNSLFTITNNQLKTNSVFDFETKNSYSVRVRTTDQGGLFFDKQLTIGVSNVNETPTNLFIDTSTVAENQVIGTVVGNLSSADPDTGSTFTYSLVTGTGATDNGLFTITNNQLKTNSVFDFQTKNSYSILIRTTDQGGLFFNKQLNISVTDLNDNNNFTTTAQQDIIDAQDGDDTIISTWANLQQNDTIKGGNGTDTLIITGGTVDDIISIDTSNTTNQLDIPGTTVFGFERFDLTSFTGTVSFDGTTGNDWVKGGTGNDDLTGGNGNDYLNGGTGTDFLIGGKGNDTFVVDNIGDIIAEGLNDGIDTVESSITWTLKTNLENLTLTGTTAINGTGNNLNNIITGNTGNNTLNGGKGNDTLTGNAGADTLIGGLGNDSLYLGLNDNVVDNVNYVFSNGTDTVYQFVRGVGGDKLNFTGIANFDVRTLGANTEIRIGDGIGGNSGFGTGQLLVTLSGTSGFTSANANINLFGGAFLFN